MFLQLFRELNKEDHIDKAVPENTGGGKKQRQKDGGSESEQFRRKRRKIGGNKISDRFEIGNHPQQSALQKFSAG